MYFGTNKSTSFEKTFQITKTKIVEKYLTTIQIIIACRGVV